MSREQELERELAGVRAELHEARDECDKWREDLGLEQGLREIDQRDFREMRDERDEWKAKAERLTKRGIEDLRHENEQLLFQRDEAKRTVEIREGALRGLVQIEKELRDKLRKEEDSEADAWFMDEARGEFDALRAALKKRVEQVEELIRECAEAKRERDEALDKLAQLGGSLMACEQKIDDQRELIFELREGIDDIDLWETLVASCNTLRSQLAAAEAESARLRDAAGNLVESIDAIVLESDGVGGMHLNGDEADWDWLLEGGGSSWLGIPLRKLRALLASPAGAAATGEGE